MCFCSYKCIYSAEKENEIKVFRCICILIHWQSLSTKIICIELKSSHIRNIICALFILYLVFLQIVVHVFWTKQQLDLNNLTIYIWEQKCHTAGFWESTIFVATSELELRLPLQIMLSADKYTTLVAFHYKRTTGNWKAISAASTLKKWVPLFDPQCWVYMYSEYLLSVQPCTIIVYTESEHSCLIHHSICVNKFTSTELWI